MWRATVNGGIRFTPRGLAELAVRTTTLRAALVGFCVCVAVTLAPVAATLGSISEPYRDLSDYVAHALVAAPFVAVGLGVFWAFLFGILTAVLAATSAPLRRIILLSPVSIVIPGLVWSIFAALEVFAHPYKGFYGPEGKPDWLSSPTIAVLGSEVWLLVGLAVVVVTCLLAKRHVPRLTDPSLCVECGYNLTGNVSGRCPECGERIPESATR
jgi:hypothetical protein